MVLALVTGSGGFAGSHLCELLVNKGYQVRGLVSNEGEMGSSPFQPRLSGVEYVTGDLLDFDSLMSALHGVDTVFHLAAVTNIPETRAKEELTWEVNGSGTMYLLKACKHAGAKEFLYASTCHVYGTNTDLPLYEWSRPKPHDVYAKSKYAGEEWTDMYKKNFRKCVVTRAFNHYGERQRGGFLIPDIINRIKSTFDHNITMKGNGQTTRDFTYVKDIVEGYYLAIEKGKHGEIYQFSSGHERTIESICRDVADLKGFKGGTFIFENRDSDINRSCGAYGKAFGQLGWLPTTGWVTGLDKTIKWWSCLK